MSNRLGGKGRGESPKLILRVTRALADAIKEAADKDRRSVSDWVRLALEEQLKQKKGR